MLIGKIVLVFFYVFSPMLILFLCHRFPFVNKLGSVVVAYIIGLILGNIGILPEGSEKIQDILTMIVIPLAIPLLLFSSDIKTWLRVAGKTMLSMVISLLAVIMVVVAGYFIFRGDIQDLWKISGMLIGVYSGGTPNLAALKLMLDVDANTYIITHTYDMVLGVVYLFFLITAGQRFFGMFLPPFKRNTNDMGSKKDFDGVDPFEGILKKKVYLPLLKALGLSVLIFAVAGGLSLLVPENSRMVVVVLFITTAGIAFSLVPSINKIEKSFELGMYFILVFSIVVASMADITKFKGLAPNLFYYVTMAVFGTLILHVAISRLFRIDTDTVIITSTALICSPPFVPVVAGALRNKEVIVSGLTVGIIGYAIGNYIGYFLANILKYL
ncbi:MAG: DUF819 domain-containing protein [Bacteroidota bacterium]